MREHKCEKMSIWKIQTCHDKWWTLSRKGSPHVNLIVTFCPFCGEKLPEISKYDSGAYSAIFDFVAPGYTQRILVKNKGKWIAYGLPEMDMQGKCSSDTEIDKCYKNIKRIFEVEQ